MEKILDVLDGTLIAMVVLLIAAVHVLVRSSHYTQLLQAVDLTALQAGFSLTTLLF